MINYKNEHLNRIAPLIRNEFPTVYITDKELNDIPPSFPYVVINQHSNEVLMNHSTFNNFENAVSESYRVNVFAKNDTDGDDIINIINEYFLEYGFRRNLYQTVPNMEDLEINRTVAAWINNAVV